MLYNLLLITSHDKKKSRNRALRKILFKKINLVMTPNSQISLERQIPFSDYFGLVPKVSLYRVTTVDLKCNHLNYLSISHSMVYSPQTLGPGSSRLRHPTARARPSCGCCSLVSSLRFTCFLVFLKIFHH